VADPATGATVVTDLRLPGQYDERLLGSVGLQGPYYNWNRWYLPGIGRYLELDPIAMKGGMNGQYGPDWYSYANGNPLRYWDSNGLTCQTNWDFFWDWVSGGGSSSRFYGGNTTETGEMMNGDGAVRLRDFFYKKGCGTVTNWCYGTGQAYLDTCTERIPTGGTGGSPPEEPEDPHRAPRPGPRVPSP
jgi:RHS repeat-associated protein